MKRVDRGEAVSTRKPRGFLIVAKITVHAESGRSRGIMLDYRAPWTNGRLMDNGELEAHSVRLVGMSKATLDLGESGTVILAPLCSEYWEDVEPGQTLVCLEGSRHVASGVVTEVLFSDL